MADYEYGKPPAFREFYWPGVRKDEEAHPETVLRIWEEGGRVLLKYRDLVDLFASRNQGDETELIVQAPTLYQVLESWGYREAVSS